MREFGRKPVISSAKITGDLGHGGWAQIHEFRPTDETKRKKRGHLFAVFSSRSAKEGMDVVVAGRELLTRFHEEYFGSEEGGAFDAVKSSVKKVILEFKPLWGSVEVACVSFLDDVIYAAAAGGSGVFLFRKGGLFDILDGKIKETSAASGYPRNGDIIICATGAFFKNISRSMITNVLEKEDLSRAVESISPTVRSSEDSGEISAVFVRYSEKKEQEVLQKLPEGKVSVLPKVPSPGFFEFLKKIFQKLPDKRIYIKRDTVDVEDVKKKKTAVSVGLILLFLLVVSIVFGIRQKDIQSRKEIYQTKLESAEHEYEEALQIASLNPERARELFLLSRERAINLSAEYAGDPRVDELIRKIEEGVEGVLGEYRVDLDLFIDLDLWVDGFRASKIASSEEVVFILDKKGKRVGSISVESKRTDIVAGSAQIDTPQEIAAYAGRVFILQEGGVYEVGKDRKKVIEKDWGGEVLINAYAGNIYLLDKNLSSIFRYSGSALGFSSGQRWLALSVDVSFSEVVSFAIDGSVFTIDKTGRILKFSLGNLQTFSVSGVSPAITSADAIYTNENLEYIYILDIKGKRIVVLTKEGTYKAQYMSDGVKDAESLFVSEKYGKIIIPTGDKLLSINLKHL